MFEHKIKTDILAYIDIHINNRFIVSVSGGMDSMALLSICASYRPLVVYFNHHKRLDVSEDIDVLNSFCLSHELTLIIDDIDIKHGNFQAEAHHQRQNKLIEIALKHDLSDVLTAHHLDDQIETILMRLVRGSDIRGYMGLKPMISINDVKFHKPMLSFTKEMIQSYIRDYNISYHEDSSNHTDVYFRNRIRHQIIPLLKQENPNLGLAFHKFHTQLSQLHNLTKQEFKEMSRSDFLLLNAYEQFEYLKHMFIEKKIPMSYKVLNLVHAFIHSKASTGNIQLKKETIFVLLKDRFYIDSLPKPTNESYDVSEGVSIIENKKVSIFYDNAPNQPGSYQKVCYNEMALPLILRHRLPSDTLVFPYGSKSLKKLMIDLKIPKHTRDTFLVLCDQNQTILWVETIYTNQVLQFPNYLNIHIEKGTSNET
jgi:tRNA(Ile)-lysidine synthetase-like protein